MKKLAAIGLAVGLIVGLAGCVPQDGNGRTKAKEHVVITNEGREVVCITIGGWYGFDCDWANAE
mgnify:CR=1 FL=1